MATQVSMFYGGYEFSPVPFVSINKNILKTGDGITRGTTFSLTLNGFLTALNENSGLATLIQKQRDLREAFDRDGKHFKIVCGEEVILECYPRIVGPISFTESNNNWVFTVPYSLVIEYENDPANEDIVGSGEDFPNLHPEFISDFQESWSVEFVPDQTNPYEFCGESNPYAVRFTHNLSAVGKSHYSGPGNTGTLDMPAWQQAASYISGYLGYNESELYNHGVLNLSGLSWAPYDHLRVVNKNETAGSYDVQESWLVLSDGTKKAIEDFTVDVNIPTLEEYSTISIQGSIRGLEERIYGSGISGFDVTGYKYNNALAYYNTIESSLLTRVQCVADDFNISPLNTQPLVKTVGHSPNQGIVAYSQTFNTRPSNCIPGSRYENIDISCKNPNDVFTLIPIVGRSTGPIIQGFNTITEFAKTINIEIGVAPVTGCNITALITGNPSQQVYNTFILPTQDYLTGIYDKVKVANDSESWLPRQGRYTRSVTWVAVDCP